MSNDATSVSRRMAAGNRNTILLRTTGLLRELTGGPFRSVALLYLSGCLYATTVMTMTGTYLYGYFHMGLIVAVICLACTRGFIDGLWRPLIRNWSAVFLFAFLTYWLMMGLTHSNTDVGMTYAKYVFNQAAPGLLLGYIAFAVYGRTETIVNARGALRWHPGILRLSIDMLAMVAYAAALMHAFITLLPQMWADIFMLAYNNSMVMVYQSFGNYLTLAFISAIHLSEPYVRWRFPRSLIIGAAWAFLLATSCWSSFLLAQMVGSNSGAALAVVIGGAVAGVAIYRDLRERQPVRALVMLSIFLLSVIWVWQLLGNLPPLRLFNFQRVINEQELAIGGSSIASIGGSSIASRLRILVDSGMEQLAVNPLFGDLAIDHVVGKPGYYLHSILSIQTHFGIIGSILFFSFLIERIVALYGSHGNILIKTFFLPLMIMATIGTLFTWMPLWFVIGALYTIRPRAELC